MTDAYNLLDDSFTTVAVRFFNDDEGRFRERGKTYSYKIPRSWVVAPDDLLVVEATTTLRIVKVVERHDEPRFGNLPNLKWAVQKIDRTEHQALVARENKFRDALLQVERQKDALVAELQRQASGSEAARLMLGDALAEIGVQAPTIIPEPAPPFDGVPPTHIPAEEFPG